MIKLYLILNDIIVPILVGFLTTSLFIIGNMPSYLIYSFLLVIFSFLKGFYDNYYSMHFSEKLRISFVTGITLIFFQMIYHSLIGIDINIIVFFSWILITILILLIRYILKILNFSKNNMTISIIGDLYKFSHHEINILNNKRFKVDFYDKFEQYFEKIDPKSNAYNLAVINTPTLTLQNNKLLSAVNSISLAQFMENYLRKIYIDDKDSFININKFDKSAIMLKRLIDYIAVLALAPLLLFVSLYLIFMKLVKGYGGSFIYRQKRYGINKKIFSIFKLRTMHIDSDSDGNTVKNGQRIYSFAKLLRKFRLDEVPQIINIISGDMHLVGPRAEWIKLSDTYSEHIDNYELRNIVRPGITG